MVIPITAFSRTSAACGGWAARADQSAPRNVASVKMTNRDDQRFCSHAQLPNLSGVRHAHRPWDFVVDVDEHLAIFIKCCSSVSTLRLNIWLA